MPLLGGGVGASGEKRTSHNLRIRIPVPLLEVQNLSVRFPVQRGFWGRSIASVKAVESVSFGIEAGQTLGLVGESGCGKTTLGRAILRLIEPTSGHVFFDGEEITALGSRELRARRRRFQMVFQDPFSSLNPRLTIGDSIGEALDIHKLTPGRAARRARIEELLGAVGLEGEYARRYPHEFSGGQRQRVGIARALAVEPRLIVCDEPVSALDVSVQAQVINLLQDLQIRHGLSYLFISHDLAVVEHLCQSVLVMYLGKALEIGATEQVCRRPMHPYTQALLSAVPSMDPESKRKRIVLGGDVPSPIHPPSGCPFHPRCPMAESRCRSEVPELRALGDNRSVACHLATSETMSASAGSDPNQNRASG
jgi:oligopeptide transport system ATP-binding protein